MSGYRRAPLRVLDLHGEIEGEQPFKLHPRELPPDRAFWHRHDGALSSSPRVAEWLTGK